MKNGYMKYLYILVMFFLFTTDGIAKNCQTSLFTVKIDSSLTIGDVIENLAETCDYSIVVKDEGARDMLKKSLYYVKVKNKPLKSLLDIILKDNDLTYVLKRGKIAISYLNTKTYRIHYIAGKRTGKSSSSITIARSTTSSSTGEDSNQNRGSGMTIESNDDFVFWENLKTEIHRILVGAADRNNNFSKEGESWTNNSGKRWEFNPLEPIVNPTAGMVTVTGTAKQLRRVDSYISKLKKQIKKQVMIEVKIISVKFNNNKTRGVDWNQLYSLQSMTVNSLIMAQKNVSSYSSGIGGIKDAIFESGTSPRNGGVVQLSGSVPVTEIVKFLNTQGKIKILSSPKIMTLNNQPALLSVGTELFYKTKSTSSSGESDFTSEGEDINSVFAGILLDITPEIGKSGEITLKINPSISDTVDPITRSITGERTMPPDLIKRQMSSVIKVKNGHHAILGGLISTRKGTRTDKVPLLGDIPLLGYAFKKEVITDETEELVIIITPYIK